MFVRAENIEDEFDESIYDFTFDILNATYTNERSKCILNNLKDNKIINDFYTTQLLFEPDTLKQKLEPYLPEAEKSCNVNFDSSSTKPIGSVITAAVGAIYMFGKKFINN